MEQNAIYHVMAHAVATGHCLPYTIINSDGSRPTTSFECVRAGGEWTDNPLSDVTQPGVEGDTCDADGHVYDACGKCNGNAIRNRDGKPVLDEQSCDCAGHVVCVSVGVR